MTNQQALARLKQLGSARTRKTYGRQERGRPQADDEVDGGSRRMALRQLALPDGDLARC